VRSLNEDMEVLQASAGFDIETQREERWAGYDVLSLRPIAYAAKSLKGAEEKVVLRQGGGWESGGLALLFAAHAAAGVEVFTPRTRALQSEIAELRAEHHRLWEEQQSLRSHIKRLEHKIDEMLAGPEDDDIVPVDPHTRWIEENMEELASHPGEWIALHSVHGILVHSVDGAEFSAMLKQIPPSERDEILVFHSSMYI
jgi:hypothetical protein